MNIVLSYLCSLQECYTGDEEVGSKIRVMAEVIDPALATARKPLELGQNPTKYLERFNLWYDHTSLLADSIGVKDKQQKLPLTLSWASQDYRQYAQDAGFVRTGEGAEKIHTQKNGQKKTHSFSAFQKKKLRQEALAKDFDYITLIKAALGYEKSRKTSGTIRATTIDVSELVHTQDEVDNIVARIIAGRCSAGGP